MDQKLILYIMNQIRKGHSPDQVRAYLVNYGYGVPIVNGALSQALKAWGAEKKRLLQENTEFKERLIRYIQENRKKGFDDFTIQNQLLASGYNYNLVREAFNLTAPGSVVRHELSNKAIFTIIGIILFAAALGFSFFFLLDSRPDELLDFRIEVISGESLKPGEKLVVSYEIKTAGKKDLFDIKLSCAIDGPSKVSAPKDTSSTEEFKWRKDSIQIPENAVPGIYNLTCDILYGDDFTKEATSAVEFKVYTDSKDPTCFDNMLNQGEEGVDCGGPCRPCATCNDGTKNQGEEDIDCGGPCQPCKVNPTCDDETMNQDETGVDCGGPCPPCVANCHDGIKNQDEERVDCGGSCVSCPPEYDLLDAQREIDSLVYFEEGITLCEKIHEKADCYHYLAIASGESDYCRKIDTRALRDNCFFDFAERGEYGLCEDIETVLVRSACLSMSNLKDLG